jgi:hypothetical protein
VAAGTTIAVVQTPATALTVASGVVSKLTVIASVAPEVPLTVTVVWVGPAVGLIVIGAITAAWTGAKITIPANNSRINSTPANFIILRIVSEPPLYISIVVIYRIYINEYYVFLTSIALIIS